MGAAVAMSADAARGGRQRLLHGHDVEHRSGLGRRQARPPPTPPSTHPRTPSVPTTIASNIAASTLHAPRIPRPGPDRETLPAGRARPQEGADLGGVVGDGSAMVTVPRSWSPKSSPHAGADVWARPAHTVYSTTS